MELNLTPFEETIKKFLDKLAKEDELFARNYVKSNKSISECCNYIYQQIEKNHKGGTRCVGCSDEEIFGLAIHYYDEDDIKVEGPKNKVEDVKHAPEVKPSSEKPKKTCKSQKSKVEDPDIPEPLEIPIF